MANINLEDLAKIIDINKIVETAKLNNLNGEQADNLVKVCAIYELQKANMKPQEFHIIKYNTYDLPYFLNEIKNGKTPIDIMQNILTECEEYSIQEIRKAHPEASKIIPETDNSQNFFKD
jgi:hypothetical protein